jgi:hypothetical protein
MKKSFKRYLMEGQVEGQESFYTLYFTPFPSKTVKDMKDGPEKEKELEIEQIHYKKLMTSFLQNVAAMN